MLDYWSLPRYHIWSSKNFWWAEKTFLKRGGWRKPALFEDVTHILSTCFLVAPSGPNLDSDLQRRVVKPPWNQRLVCHQPHNSIWLWFGGRSTPKWIWQFHDWWNDSNHVFFRVHMFFCSKQEPFNSHSSIGCSFFATPRVQKTASVENSIKAVGNGPGMPQMPLLWRSQTGDVSTGVSSAISGTSTASTRPGKLT